MARISESLRMRAVCHGSWCGAKAFASTVGSNPTPAPTMRSCTRPGPRSASSADLLEESCEVLIGHGPSGSHCRYAEHIEGQLLVCLNETNVGLALLRVVVRAPAANVGAALLERANDFLGLPRIITRR